MPLPLSPSTDMDDELNWLDRLRADAGVPETVNTEDAVLVHFNVCDERVSVHTYRRWPVGYFMMGRERRYLVATVVAFAKRRFEEAAAVRRTPSQTTRKKRIRPTPVQAQSVAAHRREAVGQQEISEEGIA